MLGYKSSFGVNNNKDKDNPAQDMRNSFNLLLIVLAWFDIFFIIIAVLDYSVARGEDVDMFILTTRKSVAFAPSQVQVKLFSSYWDIQYEKMV